MAWSKDKPMPNEVRAKISATLKGGGSLYKHGMSRSPFYRKWEAAKKRCNNPNDPRYADYGGRGIKMTWDTFEHYRDDMYEGYIASVGLYGARETTLERVDNNGPYSRNNCRWATRKEQYRNMRNNVNYTLQDITEALGISYQMVYARMRRGKSLAEALRPSSYCASCDGKGYATANEFASGRGVKWRISNMRFCTCDRGKQLEEMVGIARLEELTMILARLDQLQGGAGYNEYIEERRAQLQHQAKKEGE